jgi:hypothetical protein
LGNPPHIFFKKEMANQAAALSDPDPGTWEEAYRAQVIDAMVLLAHDDEKELGDAQTAVEKLLSGVVTILAREKGRTFKDADNKRTIR